MPTMDELVLSCQVEVEQLQKSRERAVAEVKGIIARAKGEGRPELSDEEERDVDAAFARRDKLDEQINGAKKKLAHAERARDAERDIEDDQNTRDGSKAVKLPAYDRVARVGREERTYHEQNDPSGGQFVRDVTLQFLYRNPESEARLARHMAEERVERESKYFERAAGTGAFAGLTVPQYLTDMYAPATSSARPFADVCNHHDLPAAGMTVNISRITTATSVALQSSENSAVSETNIDDTLLTENVQTAAGQQTLSRQAIERGTGVELVVLDDLYRRYAAFIDATLIGQATTGLAAISTGQTYTDGSPTSPKIYSQIIGAASTVETNLLGFAQPDTVLMHPRRFYSLLSAVNSSWPMILTPQGGPTGQSTGVSLNQPYGNSVRGILANGMRLVVDSNVTTAANGTSLTGGSQDHIYVTTAQECHLWEDSAAPVFLRAEQTPAASLGVLLVLYGYFAYSFRRYTSSSVLINGTGLAAPAFLGA